MTLAQGLAFAIVVVMMALFVWGRWRYDLVAAIALLAAVIVGVVPPDQAFKGFSDDIVIIVGSALVVSAAVARSGIIERVARWIGPYLTDINRQIVALVGSVTVLSAFVKNVGALAMLMPIAFQLARRSGTSPSSLLMPMSFGALSAAPSRWSAPRRGSSCRECASSCSVSPSICSISPRSRRHRHRRLCISGVWLAAAAAQPQRSASMDAAFNLEGYTTEVAVPKILPPPESR